MEWHSSLGRGKAGCGYGKRVDGDLDGCIFADGSALGIRHFHHEVERACAQWHTADLASGGIESDSLGDCALDAPNNWRHTAGRAWCDFQWLIVFRLDWRDVSNREVVRDDRNRYFLFDSLCEGVFGDDFKAEGTCGARFAHDAAKGGILAEV